MRTQFATALFAAAFFIATDVNAADFTLAMADKPVPKEIGDSIRGALQGKAIQLAQGDKPALEFWPRQEVPLKSKPASANEVLGAIPETTLLGVVGVNAPSLRDYKDNEIPKGVYTARYGLQPKDGDHLGTAEFDYFLILTEAQYDKDLNGPGTFKALVKASGKTTASGHPMVVSLRPAPGEGTIPRLVQPLAEHKALRVKMPGKAAGGDKTDLVFDLVYEGHGHIQ